MKRMLIIVSLLIVLMLTAALSASAESGYIRGDADGDSSVTVLDATVIQRVLAELPVNSFNEKAADVNNNGLDIMDATSIQRFLAELGNPNQIGETVNDELPTLDEYELPFIPI